MANELWGSLAVLVCVDSYEDGVPRGRLCLPGQPGENFRSLTQLLLRTEGLLEQGGIQSFTSPRVFAPAEPLAAVPCVLDSPARGGIATFELRVLFRQHASWQGELFWLEKNTRRSFRSVLELITLMDSALRAKK